jgi:hypothetical protein
MAWTKEKTITVSAQDFLGKDALGYAEFIGKDGKARLVQVVRDSDASSPREWGDMLWTWSCTNGAGYSDNGAMTLEEIENYGRREKDDSDCVPRQFMKEHLVAPLYLYRHSGDTISLGTGMFRAIDPQGFDHGRMGFAYLSREKIAKEFGWETLTKERKERLLSILSVEVATMNAWLSGDTYGIELTELDSEESESLRGIYCDDRQTFKEDVAEYIGDVAEDSEAVTMTARQMNVIFTKLCANMSQRSVSINMGKPFSFWLHRKITACVIEHEKRHKRLAIGTSTELLMTINTKSVVDVIMRNDFRYTIKLDHDVVLEISLAL